MTPRPLVPATNGAVEVAKRLGNTPRIPGRPRGGAR